MNMEKDDGRLYCKIVWRMDEKFLYSTVLVRVARDISEEKRRKKEKEK